MPVKQLYPPECPAFEVLPDRRHPGCRLRAAVICEGLGSSSPGWIDLRVLDDSAFKPALMPRAHPTEGWRGMVAPIDRYVRPLTRAAREMLALVTPCK